MTLNITVLCVEVIYTKLLWKHTGGFPDDVRDWVIKVNDLINDMVNKEHELLSNDLNSIILISYDSNSNNVTRIYTSRQGTTVIDANQLKYRDVYTGLFHIINITNVKGITVDDLKVKHTTLLPANYSDILTTKYISN